MGKNRFHESNTEIQVYRVSSIATRPFFLSNKSNINQMVGEFEGRGQVGGVGGELGGGAGGAEGLATRGVVEGVWNFPAKPAKPAKTTSRQTCKNRSQEKENRNYENRNTANPVVFAAMGRAREGRHARGMQNNSWPYGQC